MLKTILDENGYQSRNNLVANYTIISIDHPVDRKQSYLKG